MTSTKTDPKKTPAPRLTFSRGGCLLATILSALLWCLIVASCIATLSACATAPAARWEAMSVAGTGHVQVFQDGRPRLPGLYRIVATEPGKADFFRGDQYVGTGTVSVVEPTEGSVKLEVAPGARVVISPSN